MPSKSALCDADSRTQPPVAPPAAAAPLISAADRALA